MKYKKIKIAALAIVTASLLSGILYSEFGTKKSYDYSDYYVESKPSKTTKENKDNEEASEKELSLSLLKQANNDIVGILEFDNRVIYEPIVNQSYYKEHSTFQLITETETRTYQIFAVLNIDLNNLDDSLEFTQASWDSNNAFNAFISDSINRELYKTSVTVDSEDKIMTLVTCDTRDNNKRIIVIAKKI